MKKELIPVVQGLAEVILEEVTRDLVKDLFGKRIDEKLEREIDSFSKELSKLFF